MTRPKRPLPPLRFVIYAHQTIRLIPITDRKGRVKRGYWAVPGGRVLTTKELSDMCKRQGYRHAIEGDLDTNLRVI